MQIQGQAVTREHNASYSQMHFDVLEADDRARWAQDIPLSSYIITFDILTIAQGELAPFHLCDDLQVTLFVLLGTPCNHNSFSFSLNSRVHKGPNLFT